jgi:hypothetical protein
MSQYRPRGSRHFDPYRHPMHLERNRAQASGRRSSRWASPTYPYHCEQCRETFKRIETMSEMAEVRIAQLSRVGFVIGHLE